MDIVSVTKVAASTLFNTAWLAILFLYILNGARLLAIGKHQKKSMILLLGSVAFCLFMGTMEFVIHHSVNQSIQSKARVSEYQKPLPQDFGSDWKIEDRESLSRKNAQIFLASTGKITNIYHRDAGWQKFCPTDEDIALRDQVTLSDYQLNLKSETSRHKAMLWFSLTLIAVAAGWIFGKSKWDTEK